MLVPSAILSLVFSYAVDAGYSYDVTPSQAPLSELSPSSICPLKDVSPSKLRTHVHSNTCRHHHADHVFQNNISSAAFDPARDPWTIAPTCLPDTTDGEKFCVFTFESFWGGRGITILTKPSIAKEMAELPAFTNPTNNTSSLSQNDPRDPPFIVAAIPGRGMGLIANRTIERGDLIKAHASVAIFHNDCVDKSFDDYLPHKEELMKLSVNQLPPYTRDLFLAMAAHNESEEPYIEKIYTNTFGEDFGEEEHSLVVPETARMNHDCRPNAMYYFDRKTLVHYTHASRRIYAGEEITITYIDPLQTRLNRRAAIKRSWGFDCSCSLCSAENDFIRESNRRVLEINKITKILNEVVSQNETERQAAKSYVSAATEMVDLLISLYEQERLYASIADGYRLAALISASIGNEWRAVKWAMMAVETGLIHDGPDDGEILDMRRLQLAPRQHWSWAVNV
jgi:peptide methionine sulfoxide reductase MsrB